MEDGLSAATHRALRAVRYVRNCREFSAFQNEQIRVLWAQSEVKRENEFLIFYDRVLIVYPENDTFCVDF